jgi:hypothetical protein
MRPRPEIAHPAGRYCRAVTYSAPRAASGMIRTALAESTSAYRGLAAGGGVAGGAATDPATPAGTTPMLASNPAPMSRLLVARGSRTW